MRAIQFLLIQERGYRSQPFNHVLESRAREAYTDIEGYFGFTDLLPGTYNVEEEVPPGWVASTPTYVDGIVLESGDHVHLNFVFGNFELAPS
jgi:hypothetical protein